MSQVSGRNAPSGRIQVGSVVRVLEYERLWVALEVTEADLENGINADNPGLHGFGGMWYGDDPLSKDSYGKIIYFDGNEEIVGTIDDFSLEELKRLVD